MTGPPSARRARHLAVVLVALLALTGCTSEPAPAPSPTPEPSPTALARNDPDREALTAAVTELQNTLAALRTSLEAAADGTTGALTTAAELLVAEPSVVLTTPPPADALADDADAPADAPDDVAPTAGPTPRAGPAPILPGPLTSREESFEYGDLLTLMLGAARGAGSVGEPALRFLADPLAGDLGAWQRAPDDQLDAIARAGTAPDLAATEMAVLDLAGEAPRALAWVVHGLTVPADAEDAAGRALAHLAIIELTLDQLA